MDRTTFESQKKFAGEKKPSMLRRCVGHDYSGRQMYLVTMVTEGRRPLLGQLTGRSDAPADRPLAPRIVLSELGWRVQEELLATHAHHPEIEVIAHQMMPDHVHAILFVREQMEHPLGMAIRGFKQSCNRHYRELVLGVPCVALTTQHTERPTQHTERRDRRGEDRSHGLLFARGYNDRLLLRAGQLDRWLQYLADNPRRLLMKRERPDLFRVQRGVVVAGQQFSCIGNRLLLTHPLRSQVQYSRSLTPKQIAIEVEMRLAEARLGAVMVSPSVSDGEKAVMRAVFDAGLPVIQLLENGFTDLAKPGGQRFDACARGQLLLMAPWEHHNERRTITRSQCLQLNELARLICEAGTTAGTVCCVDNATY